MTPNDWERRRGLHLRFVFRRTGPSLLVADKAGSTRSCGLSRSKSGRCQVTAPTFLLVAPVKLPKRLDLARDAERAPSAVPGPIVSNRAEERTR
jgi:hypothetical protein